MFRTIRRWKNSFSDFIEEHIYISVLIGSLVGSIIGYGGLTAMTVITRPEPLTHSEHRDARDKLKVQKQLFEEEMRAIRKELKELEVEIEMTQARQYVMMETLVQYTRNNEVYVKGRVDEFIDNAIKDRHLVFEADDIDEYEEKTTSEKRKPARTGKKPN